jgi:hypothetical protein
MNNITEYHNSITQIGLSNTWKQILENNFPNDFFTEDRLGGLYEDGLAFANKIEKKAMGKYYTPIDVANVLSAYFLKLSGDNICDLCCGTGNLILSVLEQMGNEEARCALEEGRIYLYDIDETAVSICVAILKNRYGECANNINIIIQDCLNKEVHFPNNSKIISNPPYGKMDELRNMTYPCAQKTKELYVAFMEKVISERVPAVIITPHSFLGGNTFKELRKEMISCGGTIFSFDNVPANIFKGKKFGIFNSNEANSTRAAITIIDPEARGFVISPFIRFKSEEREEVLNCDFLNSLLPNNTQKGDDIFYRIENGTEELVAKWLNSKKKLKDLLSSVKTDFRLDVPTTCRYFTTAAEKSLNRKGKMTLYCKDEESFYLAYAFINSTLCYYWHRMCNGGVTYPVTLIKDMPIFGQVTQDLRDFCLKMIAQENEYIVLKKNAGSYQENIKFPMSYREHLNKLLGVEENILFIHANSCFSREIDLSDEVEEE